jgi:uncharacterized protein (DUF1778 family)
MYGDPALIRKHTVKLRFNDNEARLVDALVAYTGEEKAAFIRSLILDRATEVLHADESAAFAAGTRGAQAALIAA